MRRGVLAALLVVVLASLTFAQAPEPPDNFRIPPDPTDRRALTVTRSGSGSGSVAGPGITCGADCSENYIVDTTVVIHATAASGSTFTGWSGACSGTGSCSVLMSAAKAVTATFTLSIFDLYAKATGGATTGTCSTTGTACRLDIALQVQTATAAPAGGRTLGLLDGTYQGATGMLAISTHVPGKSGTDDTHRYIVKAVNDGGVFIDGQFAREPLRLDGESYWSFIGFDVGNSSGSVVFINGGTGHIFQRIVASNASNAVFQNVHHWASSACVGCLFEDIAGFGTGRNSFVDDGNHSGTILRRAWLRWDGSDRDDVRTPLQCCYDTTGSATYENVITVWGANQQYGALHNPNAPSILLRTPGVGSADRFRGIIAYATGSDSGTTTYGFVHMSAGTQPGMTITDMFVDARGQNAAYLSYLSYGGSSPSGSRFTGIRLSTQNAAVNDFMTNFNECIATLAATGASLGGCPSFYTGDTPGTGARNCFEYSGGTLTSTKLWPWRMDDRIKAAITRAGGTALTGSVGSGYAANTVTSEIVSRYGAVPAGCLR